MQGCQDFGFLHDPRPEDASMCTCAVGAGRTSLALGPSVVNPLLAISIGDIFDA